MSAIGCVYDYNTEPCDDGDACTTDACDPATGCVSTPVSCPPGQVCVDGVCVPIVFDTVHFRSVASSGDEGVSPANLHVDLNFTVEGTESVDYRVVSGTASGGGVDYTLADGTLDFTIEAEHNLILTNGCIIPPNK